MAEGVIPQNRQKGKDIKWADAGRTLLWVYTNRKDEAPSKPAGYLLGSFGMGGARKAAEREMVPVDTECASHPKPHSQAPAGATRTTTTTKNASKQLCWR